MVDFFRFTSTLLVSLIFVSLAVICVLTLMFFPHLLLYVVVACLVILAISIMLALKLDLNNELISLSMLVSSLAVAFIAGFAGNALSRSIWEISNPFVSGVSVALGFVVTGWLVDKMIHKIWDKSISIQGNTVLVVKTPTKAITYKGGDRFYPLFMMLDFELARIPINPMSHTFSISNINTKELYDIDVQVEVHYKYVIEGSSWGKIMGYPDRPDIFQRIKKETDGKWMKDPAFWEKVFEYVIKAETDRYLRDMIYDKIAGGEEMYRNRDTIALQAREELNTIVQQWGITVTRIEFPTITLPEECRIAFNYETRARKDTELKADLKSRYISRVRATSIRESVKAVIDVIQTSKEKGTKLTEAEIREIVRTSMQEIAFVFRAINDPKDRMDPLEGMDTDDTNGNGPFRTDDPEYWN